jgi:hypothetical protein
VFQQRETRSGGLPVAEGDLEIALACPKPFQKRLALVAQFGFELFGAIAIATCPRFGSIFVPAIPTRMGVFDAYHLEVLLPIRPLLGQRRIAKTSFNPGGDALVVHSGFLHVVNVLVSGNGTLAERFTFDRMKKRQSFSALCPGFNKVTHKTTLNRAWTTAHPKTFPISESLSFHRTDQLKMAFVTRRMILENAVQLSVSCLLFLRITPVNDHRARPYFSAYS